MQDFEKLGAFYLGKSFDLAARTRRDDLVMYDSKDMVTHAVCVGMTGSGKTGLCVGILEEAAIDGIPSIVIDPKGDLSNLLLTFPDLKPGDFRPWINEDDATKKGLTPDQFAEAQAKLWTKGLADWGQDGARIKKLKDSADFAVYTPGSNAGLPISILKSFDAPGEAIRDDAELFRDQVATTATSVLGLLGIDADPIKSREHILISSLLSNAWSKGEGMDLGGLIAQIQKPPVTRIGVMDIESVFPSKDRFELAMALNNLLAAPGFSAWMEGEALDVGALLRTPGGKPRVSIFSIAHLSDSERMFFVSLLFNQILGWVRTQSGTTSLRALVYMDEIAGYFPPTANPPSKKPMLTLMKQARAFGVGMMFATQNPVDIDYKGLANAGTWFIGRLQTQRDKDRVLDGLEGAAAAASAKFDRASADKTMSALGARVFLMNNVHEDAPEIFETRWCLSYLRGPLTRTQIKMLVKKDGSKSADQAAAAKPAASASTSASAAASRPVLPPEIPQFFIPVRSSKPAGAKLVYQPSALGVAKIYYQDAKTKVDQTVDQSLMGSIGTGVVALDWDAATQVELSESDLESEASAAAGGAAFAPLPPGTGTAKQFDAWKKQLADAMFRTAKLSLLRSSGLEEVSKPGESERDFRARLAQSAREERDRLAEELRKKYAPKMATIQERIRKAEQQLEVQKTQSRDAKLGSFLSAGAAVLSAFLGRKAISASSVSRGITAAKSVGKTMKESGDVGRAEENIESLQQQLADLETQFKADTDAAAARIDPTTEKLESIAIKPKKTNITVRLLALAWTPTWVDASGTATSAWE
jgi:hypothetical protein